MVLFLVKLIEASVPNPFAPSQCIAPTLRKALVHPALARFCTFALQSLWIKAF
jgi:hypothetical protein